MQRTRILLSIGDKNMENYFLLFMDNKIARGSPSRISSIILLVLVLLVLQMGISPSMNLVSILLKLYKLCLEKYLK